MGLKAIKQFIRSAAGGDRTVPAATTTPSNSARNNTNARTNVLTRNPAAVLNIKTDDGKTTTKKVTFSATADERKFGRTRPPKDVRKNTQGTARKVTFSAATEARKFDKTRPPGEVRNVVPPGQSIDLDDVLTTLMRQHGIAVDDRPKGNPLEVRSSSKQQVGLDELDSMLLGFKFPDGPKAFKNTFTRKLSLADKTALQEIVKKGSAYLGEKISDTDAETAVRKLHRYVMENLEWPENRAIPDEAADLAGRLWIAGRLALAKDTTTSGTSKAPTLPYADALSDFVMNVMSGDEMAARRKAVFLAELGKVTKTTLADVWKPALTGKEPEFKAKVPNTVVLDPADEIDDRQVYGVLHGLQRCLARKHHLALLPLAGGAVMLMGHEGQGVDNGAVRQLLAAIAPRLDALKILVGELSNHETITQQVLGDIVDRADALECAAQWRLPLTANRDGRTAKA